MKTSIRTQDPAEMDTECLVVFAISDSTDKKAVPKLLTANSKIRIAAEFVLKSGEFRGRTNETALVHQPEELKARRLLLVGLGDGHKLTVTNFGRAAGTSVRFVRKKHMKELNIVLPQAKRFDAGEVCTAIVIGAEIADFRTDQYKSSQKVDGLSTLVLCATTDSDTAELKASMQKGSSIGKWQNFTRTLANAPGNKMTPTILAAQAHKACLETGLTCQIYDEAAIRKLKMGAFLGVAQGSAEPPKLIQITYEPATKKRKSNLPVLALVGKGITFDSGGISLKPPEGMHRMKGDMAGAAAVIGAMQVIAELKPNVRVIGIVCACENMPSSTAQKPGDIQIAMSGKSIEIINTDAEGRLILADGLTFAKKLGASHLVDIATLTGACAIALGSVYAGLFANDEDIYDHFRKGAEISGEKFWRLPLDDEYKVRIRSQVADMVNSAGREGGAINAAKFLQEFAEDTPWIHLDIAGVSNVSDDHSWMSKGPSGFGLYSLVEWVKSYSS